MSLATNVPSLTPVVYRGKHFAFLSLLKNATIGGETLLTTS